MDTPQTSPENGGSSGTKQGSFWANWKKKILVWALVLGILLVVIWALTIFVSVQKSSKDVKPSSYLTMHGIIPRKGKGIIPGIIAAPFLHTGFEHVEADSLGILILGTLLMLSSVKTFFSVTGFVWVVGGLLAWCVSRPDRSIIGTGLWCFGWFGYLIVTPFFVRPISPKSIALAAVAGLLYGGIIFGLFSTNPAVAWEANICCLVSGIICSVGYWHFYRKYIAKYVEKYAPNFSAKLPTSPQLPFSKFTQSEAFPRSTGEKDSAILPQTSANTTQPAQKGRLLDERNSSNNPFGAQEIFQEPQAPTGLISSSEPEWLFGPKSTVPGASSSSAYTSSSNPSWLQPAPQNQNLEMGSFASAPPSAPPQPAQNTTFNPFD